MRKREVYIRLLLAVLGLSFGLACFNVRPVEPPSSSASDWISPTDYQILLENLKTAIAQRNSRNYIRCFSEDGLDFTPAASVFNNNESIWLNWSIQDEQSYFENTLASLTLLAGNSLSLEETDIQDVTSDSLRYVGDYTLRINHGDTSITQVFLGQVQLIIKLNGFNEWEIHRWIDIEAVQDSSWSLLKLRYVQ